MIGIKNIKLQRGITNVIKDDTIEEIENLLEQCNHNQIPHKNAPFLYADNWIDIQDGVQAVLKKKCNIEKVCKKFSFMYPTITREQVQKAMKNFLDKDNFFIKKKLYGSIIMTIEGYSRLEEELLSLDSSLCRVSTNNDYIREKTTLKRRDLLPVLIYKYLNQDFKFGLSTKGIEECEKVFTKNGKLNFDLFVIADSVKETEATKKLKVLVDDYLKCFQDFDRYSNSVDITTRLRNFILKYEMTAEVILKATKMYLSTTDAQFIRQPQYFISKSVDGEVISDLLTYCERVKKDDESSCKDFKGIK